MQVWLDTEGHGFLLVKLVKFSKACCFGFLLACKCLQGANAASPWTEKRLADGGFMAYVRESSGNVSGLRQGEVPRGLGRGPSSFCRFQKFQAALRGIMCSETPHSIDSALWSAK